MKAKARFYRGIEFIQVSDLSTRQQLLLEHSREPERIKILIDGKIEANCIQYKKYCEWFSAVYSTSVATAKVENVEQETLPVEIALGKA